MVKLGHLLASDTQHAFAHESLTFILNNVVSIALENLAITEAPA
jgi:hypothetical protein